MTKVSQFWNQLLSCVRSNIGEEGAGYHRGKLSQPRFGKFSLWYPENDVIR